VVLDEKFLVEFAANVFRIFGLDMRFSYSLAFLVICRKESVGMLAAATQLLDGAAAGGSGLGKGSEVDPTVGALSTGKGQHGEDPAGTHEQVDQLHSVEVDRGHNDGDGEPHTDGRDSDSSGTGQSGGGLDGSKNVVNGVPGSIVVSPAPGPQTAPSPLVGVGATGGSLHVDGEEGSSLPVSDPKTSALVTPDPVSGSSHPAVSGSGPRTSLAASAATVPGHVSPTSRVEKSDTTAIGVPIVTATFQTSSIATQEKLFFANFHNAAQQLSLLGIKAVGLATQIQAIRGHMMMLKLIDEHIATLAEDEKKYTDLLQKAHIELRKVVEITPAVGAPEGKP
jgi:hypothetical protein